MNKFEKVQRLALKYGAQAIRISKKKNKKYDVLYNGNKWLSFGDSRYEDFLDHKDKKRRESYRKRSSKITSRKTGKYTYLDPNYANYWSYNILW